MLSLNDYHSVIAVYDERHFARAADRLGITQPALTARLRRIEEIVGTRLFSRGRAGVSPTAAGSAFVEGAQRVIDAAEMAEDAARAASSGLGQILRVGFTQIAADQVLIPCLRALHDAHPEGRIRLTEGTTAGLERMLEESTIDLAFIHPPLHAPGLSQRTVHTTPLRKKSFRPDTDTAPLIRYPRAEAPVLMGLVDRHDDADTAPSSEADTAIGAMALSKAGYGPALLPAGFRALGDTVSDTPDSEIVLETCIAWRSLDRRPVIRTFLDLADAALKSP